MFMAAARWVKPRHYPKEGTRAVGTLWVRHAPASASVVRRAVFAALTDAGATADDSFEGALIASELVGNSIRHARPLPSGHLSVTWQIVDDEFTLAVTDGGGDRQVAVQHAEAWQTTGRGLAIVAAVADRWGVRSEEHGNTVWAARRLSLPCVTPNLRPAYAIG